MNKFKIFVGIDVSKNWLDFSIVSDVHNKLNVTRVENDQGSIKTFVQSLKIRKAITLFCLESTGKYTIPFMDVTSKLKLNTWLAHPLNIKLGQGVTRGKSDRIDAIRIAEYACRFRDKVELWTKEPESISKLRELQTQRNLLIKIQTQLLLSNQGSRYKSIVMADLLQNTKEAISKTDQLIAMEIKSDVRVFELYKLITSVPGVGPVLASLLLVITRGFTRLTVHRKLACFCGVAPFSESSGISLKRKGRVSQFASRHLKATLYLGARSAIRSNAQFRSFYERKIAEGKPKLVVNNAVRNKLLGIVVSVVRRGEPFSKEYLIRSEFAEPYFEG